MSSTLVHKLLAVASKRDELHWYLKEVLSNDEIVQSLDPHEVNRLTSIIKKGNKKVFVENPLQRHASSIADSQSMEPVSATPSAPHSVLTGESVDGVVNLSMLADATLALPGTLRHVEAASAAANAERLPPTLASVVKTQSSIWAEGSSSVSKLRDLVHHMGAVMELQADATDLSVLSTLPQNFLEIEYRHMTKGIPELNPDRDIEDLVVSDVSSVHSSELSEADGEAELPPGLLAQRRKLRKEIHRKAKADEKLENRRNAIIARRLPPGVELRDASKDTKGFTVEFQPRTVKGVPSEAEAETTIKFQKQRELAGAIMQLGAISSAEEGRKRRWTPCFRALDDLERALKTMELFSRRAVSTEDLDHPSRITKTDRDDVLSEGLRPENEELSAFLVPWLQDLQQRLNVLLVYEQTKRNNKMHNMGHRGTQTNDVVFADDVQDLLRAREVEIEERARALSSEEQKTWYEDMGADRNEGNIYAAFSAEASPAAARHEHRSVAASSSGSFGRIAERTVAALRIQSMYRGYFTRTIVGNVHTGFRTFFQSADLRVARMWCKFVVHGCIPPHSELWLTACSTNLLVGKACADFVATKASSQPKSFVDFSFDHFAQSFDGSTTAKESFIAFLSTLHQHGDADPLFVLVRHLLMGDFSPFQESVVSRALLPLSRCISNADSMTMQFLTIDFEVDHPVQPSAMKNIVRQLAKQDEFKIVLDRMYSFAHRLFYADDRPKSIDGRVLKELLAFDSVVEQQSFAVERRLTHKQFLLCLVHSMHNNVVCTLVD